jgi:hypothetical protein
MSTDNCTSVSPSCPASATIYGYYPTLGGSSFFVALFAILSIAQIGIGIWKRTWSFMAWVSIACLLECLGYIGRIMMHANPWSVSGFEMQIVCLVLAPTFLAAGLYLSMKHVINFLGPEHSRIKPKLYPWIFITCDICSIIIQAIGGGVADSGSSESVINAGDDLIVAGIAFQVVTMVICGSLTLDYYLRRRKANQQTPANDKSTNDKSAGEMPQQYGTNSKKDRQFRFYCSAIAFAYFAILIRCIYRIPEMAGGWGNPRMREEVPFLVLDGSMIALAGIAFTLAHPGIMFPNWNQK